MLLDCLIMVGCIALLAGPAILRNAWQNDVLLMNGPIYSIILAAIALLITVALLLVAVFRQPHNRRQPPPTAAVAGLRPQRLQARQ
ncbi:hypothetical protein MXD63_33430 [Frankia sp. Cpl3]|nr:hypothetical protein [Frankia sp. Cpl3]